MWAPTLVCHQLRSRENLGAIARLMANFGATRLILSDPVTHDFRGAATLAVGAEDILEGMAIANSLPEALAGAVFAVGTTSRTTLKRFVPVLPEVGAALLAEHAAHGPVALVLGGEKRGLSDDELAHCQAVIAIPTPGPQPSMNVSHAAALLLYACSRAQVKVAAVAGQGAPLKLVAALEEKMQQALLAVEFLNPQAPEHVLKELVRSLVHAKLSTREAQLWLTAFEHVRRVVTSSRAGRSAD